MRSFKLAPDVDAEVSRGQREVAGRRWRKPTDGAPRWCLPACRPAGRLADPWTRAAIDRRTAGPVDAGSDSWPDSADIMTSSPTAHPPLLLAQIRRCRRANWRRSHSNLMTWTCTASHAAD